jgi:hypothetical protein
MKSYIRLATTRQKILTWIKKNEYQIDNFISTLAEKSKNNFMYLYYVLLEIEHGLYKNLNIEEIPIGLEAYYEDHWRRMGMQSKPLPRTKIKTIYILAILKEPVMRDMICDFTGEDTLTIQEIIDEWTQFLRKDYIRGEICYSIYHDSFREFLYRKDIVRAARVKKEEINALIADNLWKELMQDG